ncbi:putative molybdopterin oxidoreductase subunit protein [Rhodovulum sp. PH10]|uniref:cytochrome c3 family protein n=1 Tax=Rhodovulum sp. PH10 TaxID=1187851 RepID=UPI00027C2B05|nr:cytochrome c3 family protein [Rhodovulum sp. PH10]EJW12534.1 putative molybdopterin oxidoreductase subunit protein [Rhodovulum sp. PH10]
MQIFRKGADTTARVLLVLGALTPLAGVGFAYAFHRASYTTGDARTPRQPVPFSHAHHVGGLGLDCRYCHTSVEKSRFAGMPPTETCMTCHSQIWTNAAMLAPVRESLARDEPLRWTRVYDLPGYVYFDHSSHVNNGVGCTTCHGRIDRMPLTRQAAPLTMAWCIDCHRDPTKALRPKNAIFDLGWTPPKDQDEQGARLAVRYHIRLRHLTDCSTCHR